jgi:hypothetical protein
LSASVLWHAANAEEEGVYLNVLRKAFNELGYIEGKMCWNIASRRTAGAGPQGMSMPRGANARHAAVAIGA